MLTDVNKTTRIKSIGIKFWGKAVGINSIKTRAITRLNQKSMNLSKNIQITLLPKWILKWVER